LPSNVVFAAPTKGSGWLALCPYELADGKIHRIRRTYDRPGWLEGTVVHSLV